MDIELKNIALIEEGNIELKGITLIADENDSGKSTIGKTLFTTLTTLNNFEREFLTNLSQRIKTLHFTLREVIDERLENESGKIVEQNFLTKIKKFTEKIDNFSKNIDQIIKNFIKIEINEKYFKDLENAFFELIEDTDILKKELETYIEKKNVESDSMLVLGITFLVNSLNNLLTFKAIFNYEKVKLSSFQRTFDREFENNINNVFLNKEKSSVILNENGDLIKISIDNNRVSSVSFTYGKIKKESSTIYIESPLILDYIDELSRTSVSIFDNENRYFFDKNYKIKVLKNALKNEKKIDIVDTVLGKEELYKDLLEKIHKIILGEFEYNKSNKDFIYRKQGYTFDKKNVATGIKSFGIIEILLKNKQLDENTILIIDEPEVHLHPKWQIKYAEILILISKELGVKILLNSHSPYLIRAMEVYRKTHDYEENIKFYTLADCIEGKSKKIIDVTNNLNQIFDKLIEPYEILREVDERYSDDE